MRFKNLDLNLLVAFDTLIRLRNVSRAAEEMFITQSAMSNALNRLREYFDDPLLIQVGRRLELSPLAQSLEAPLRDIIVRIETAVLTTPSFSPADTTRTVSLVVSDYTLQTIAPPFVARVAALAPGLKLDFKPQQNFPHVLLERGEADLLIAPTVFCSSSHPSERLFEDEIACVADASSVLAQGAVTEERFLAAGHVVMQPPNGGESFAQRVCRELGLAIRIEVSTFSFAALPVLVRGTDRVALVQRTLAECMIRLGGLTLIDVPFAFPRLEQSVQWHSFRTRDPALVWLRTQLSEAARDVLAAT